MYIHIYPYIFIYIYIYKREQVITNKVACSSRRSLSSASQSQHDSPCMHPFAYTHFTILIILHPQGTATRYAIDWQVDKSLLSLFCHIHTPLSDIFSTFHSSGRSRHASGPARGGAQIRSPEGLCV